MQILYQLRVRNTLLTPLFLLLATGCPGGGGQLNAARLHQRDGLSIGIQNAQTHQQRLR